MKHIRVLSSLAIVIGLSCTVASADSPSILLHANMAELKCAPPDANAQARVVEGNAPGLLFLEDEPVGVRLLLTKPDEGPAASYAIEIQEIGMRTPGKTTQEAWTDTAGNAQVIDLINPPVAHPVPVAFGDKNVADLWITNLPVPKRYGTFALVWVAGQQRTFLCTLCRLPQPRPYGTIDNVPIFGEGQLLDMQHLWKMGLYYRMGVRGWRSELSWNETKDGNYRWDDYDKFFSAAEAAGEKVMVTLGGHPDWTRPFGSPTPAANYKLGGGGYGGTGDWLCEPNLYPRYGRWIEAFCQRYWKDGQGALWGLENYNEPWEGGGISGWARDLLQYRQIQRTIGQAARKVSPDIKLLAASSIMNTEDKLYSDGSNEFDAWLDIFTDHYVPPAMCYGPMVARKHGKTSMETETWFVNTEFLLAQGVAQFMACGQRHIAPWHPRVLFDKLADTMVDSLVPQEGNKPPKKTPVRAEGLMIPTPVVAATAAFNYFTTGKGFEKMVFRDHLPFVFQFGKDDDPSALLVVFGKLLPIGGDNPKEVLWAQVNDANGGTLTVDNADGLLKFYDLAGNPQHVGDKTVALPMTIYPTYITCDKGPAAAAERLKAARIDGKRPVEILPHDFSKVMGAAGNTLTVAIHNCYNRKIAGKLTVAAPEGVILKADRQAVELEAGQTQPVVFEIASAAPNAANAYPFRFDFASDAGDANYAEALNVAIAKKATMAIDGRLDKWKDIPGIVISATKSKTDVTELMRRPWLKIQEEDPNGTHAEVKLAWDDNYLYVCARVNDPTDEPFPIRMEGRDENSYFHTAADDAISPYKEFLLWGANGIPKPRVGKKVDANGPAPVPPTQPAFAKSFGDVPYVYRRSPEGGIPFRRDRLQVAFDVTDDWHDLQSDTDKVPYGFHNVPDTDYEYSLYLCGDGNSELWRQLAPGVPRIHDWPRQPRGENTTGPVAGAKHLVKREGSVYIYEMAIPKSELANLKLTAGTTFGFVFKIGNSKGPSIEYGHDKAVCKINGLTLHPYWERSPSAGVRWTLAE